MNKLTASLAVFAVLLTGVSAATASELPTDSICHIAAEEAYMSAVNAGDGLPDGAYEWTMSECELALDSETDADEMIAPVLAMLAR